MMVTWSVRFGRNNTRLHYKREKSGDIWSSVVGKRSTVGHENPPLFHYSSTSLLLSLFFLLPQQGSSSIAQISPSLANSHAHCIWNLDISPQTCGVRSSITTHEHNVASNKCASLKITPKPFGFK